MQTAKFDARVERLYNYLCKVRPTGSEFIDCSSLETRFVEPQFGVPVSFSLMAFRKILKAAIARLSSVTSVDFDNNKITNLSHVNEVLDSPSVNIVGIKLSNNLIRDPNEFRHLKVYKQLAHLVVSNVPVLLTEAPAAMKVIFSAAPSLFSLTVGDECFEGERLQELRNKLNPPLPALQPGALTAEPHICAFLQEYYAAVDRRNWDQIATYYHESSYLTMMYTGPTADAYQKLLNSSSRKTHSANVEAGVRYLNPWVRDGLETVVFGGPSVAATRHDLSRMRVETIRLGEYFLVKVYGPFEYVLTSDASARAAEWVATHGHPGGPGGKNKTPVNPPPAKVREIACEMLLSEDSRVKHQGCDRTFLLQPSDRNTFGACISNDYFAMRQGRFACLVEGEPLKPERETVADAETVGTYPRQGELDPAASQRFSPPYTAAVLAFAGESFGKVLNTMEMEEVLKRAADAAFHGADRRPVLTERMNYRDSLKVACAIRALRMSQQDGTLVQTNIQKIQKFLAIRAAGLGMPSTGVSAESRAMWELFALTFEGSRAQFVELVQVRSANSYYIPQIQPLLSL